EEVLTMRAARILAVIAASLAGSGCGDLLSLHALYTAKDQVLDPAIEALLADQYSWLMLERENSGYRLTITSNRDKKEITKFEAHLVDIAGVRFADIIPNEGIGHM